MEQLAAQDLGDLIDLERYQLDDPIHLAAVKARLDREGVVILPDFLRASARDALVLEAEKQAENAFFTTSTHNVYLTSQDQSLPAEHIVNRQIKSSKGCITTDQIPEGSGLKTLYHNPQFQSFITAVLGEKALYAYADPLSSINVHYAHEGQELGWHFDNSSFAITHTIHTLIIINKNEIQILSSLFTISKSFSSKESSSTIFTGITGSSSIVKPPQPRASTASTKVSANKRISSSVL